MEDGSSYLNVLDEVLVKYFTVMETISSLRLQLDKELRDGFLWMAKARSNMGQKFLSSLQFDERDMNASSTISVEEGIFDLTLDENKKASKQKTDMQQEIETLGADEASEPSSGTERKPVNKDPLLMFGVLVPRSLRSSQQCFKRCLHVTTKLCEAQQQAEALASQYKDILTRVDNSSAEELSRKEADTS